MSDLAPALRQQLAPLIRSARLGVMTDIDGTISPLALTPATARVDPHCQAALARLADRLPRVAVISGRAAVDACAMVNIPNVVYIGNHGLERCQHGVTIPDPQAAAWIAGIAAALADLPPALELPVGVLIENKGLTASIHYRLAPDPEATATVLAELLGLICAEHGLQLAPGRMIFEVRPPIHLNKGTAIASLIGSDHLTAAVFLGDDVTDVDGFRAVQAARSGGIAALAIGVLSAETPEVVRATCDVSVAGVAGVAAVLGWIAEHYP